VRSERCKVDEEVKIVKIGNCKKKSKLYKKNDKGFSLRTTKSKGFLRLTIISDYDIRSKKTT